MIEENLDSMEECPPLSYILYMRTNNMNEEKKRKEPDINKPAMFLRAGVKGGLYFFSPKKTTIFYLNRRHVEELLEGKRKSAVIHKHILWVDEEREQ